MDKKIHFITIITIAMAMGSFLFPFDSLSEHNLVAKEYILKKLKEEGDKTKPAIEQAKKIMIHPMIYQPKILQ